MRAEQDLFFTITLISVRILIKVKNNIITVINYELYCELSKAKHPAFPITVSGWSQMTELLRFICNQTEESGEDGRVDNSKEFVIRQV